MKLIVASWSLIAKIALSAAYPQINGDNIGTGNDDMDRHSDNPNIYQDDPHSVGYATILVNNERRDLTERTTPLDPPLDVGLAMIIDAPHGSGCFFSRSVTDEQSRLDSTFVSQTFYNTGRDDLTIPFPAASFVTCFMIPESPEPGIDESVVLWLEQLSSSSSSSSSSSPSPVEPIISPAEEPSYELKFLNLLQESRPYTLGVHHYNEPMMLAGAAVVHAPRPEVGCLAMEHLSGLAQPPEEPDPIVQEGPLVKNLPPVSEPMLYEEPPPIVPTESDDGFVPAGRADYFTLGNPLLDFMQTYNIHCFRNRSYRNR